MVQEFVFTLNCGFTKVESQHCPYVLYMNMYVYYILYSGCFSRGGG